MNRYSNISIIKNPKGKRMYTEIKYPDVPLSENDAYILCNNTDRYDKLAQTYYGDSSLWWVISIANNASSQDSLFPPLDAYIRIPGNYVDVITKFNILNKSSNSSRNPNNIKTY
tara:strand:+ start:471 stop:812 length:342 start_codon:yes stop_codon:yes gene_type:complete